MMMHSIKTKRWAVLAAVVCFALSSAVQAQDEVTSSDEQDGASSLQAPQLVHSQRFGWRMQLCGTPTMRTSQEGLSEKHEVRSANGNFQCLSSLTILPVAVTDPAAREELLRAIPAQAVAMMQSMMQNTKLESVNVDSARGETEIRVSTRDPLLGDVQVALRLVVQGRRMAMVTASWPRKENHQFEAEQVLGSLQLDPKAPVENESLPADPKSRI